MLLLVMVTLFLAVNAGVVWRRYMDAATVASDPLYNVVPWHQALERGTTRFSPGEKTKDS